MKLKWVGLIALLSLAPGMAMASKPARIKRTLMLSDHLFDPFSTVAVDVALITFFHPN